MDRTGPWNDTRMRKKCQFNTKKDICEQKKQQIGTMATKKTLSLNLPGTRTCTPTYKCILHSNNNLINDIVITLHSYTYLHSNSFDN